MKITRTGSVAWRGGLHNGLGEITTQSGALKNHPYGFGSRFAAQNGSNPEELIGAAHAACFAMALSLVLERQGREAELLAVQAAVTLTEAGDGFTIDEIRLTLTARIAELASEEFMRLANLAKDTCPVSRLVRARVLLEAKLLTP